MVRSESVVVNELVLVNDHRGKSMPFLILEHSVIPNFYPIISILLALVSLVLLEILEIEVWLIG